MTAVKQFTYRSARSGGLLAGILLVLVSEGVGIHLWVARKSIGAALALTAMTLSAIAWLALDYVSLGSGAIRLTSDALYLHIGRRHNFEVPRSAIANAVIPVWREIPESGSTGAQGYVNLMKHADPNVLLTLAAPVTVRLPGGRHRMIDRIALHVDDPRDLVDELAQPSQAEQNINLQTLN